MALGLDALASAGSDLVNFAGNAVTQRMNNSMAKDAFNRQLSADSTQYQRTVADLKAAGLNPMLAYMGSSDPTPNAQVASMPSESYGSDLLQGVSSAAQASKTAGADTANTEMDTLLKAFQQQIGLTQIALNNSASALNQQKELQVAQEVRESAARIPLISAQGSKAKADAAEADVKKSLYQAIQPFVDKLLRGMSSSVKDVPKGTPDLFSPKSWGPPSLWN